MTELSASSVLGSVAAISASATALMPPAELVSLAPCCCELPGLGIAADGMTAAACRDSASMRMGKHTCM